MPDYEADNIPILDDVIEDETSSEKHTGKENNNLDLFTAEPVVQIDAAETEEDESSLTTEASAESTIEDEQYLQQASDMQFSANHHDAEIDDEDDSIVIDVTDAVTDNTADDATADDAAADEAVTHDRDNTMADEAFSAEPSELIESALIDYRGETDNIESWADVTAHDENDELESRSESSDNEQVPAELDITLPQIELQPLVNDIVKQLMPDLEQQLRFLVQQALEDRLPEEIIKKED